MQSWHFTNLDLWFVSFIKNAVENSWKSGNVTFIRDGILTTSSLSLSLFISWTFEFMEFDATFQKWNCLDVFDVSEKQFLQKPINAPDACLYFPLVRILFEIKMKNCEYSVSIYFSSAISLSFFLHFEIQIKEYLKKKKKETFFHFLRSFIKKFYSLQFPITEFVRLRIS